MHNPGLKYFAFHIPCISGDSKPEKSCVFFGIGLKEIEEFCSLVYQDYQYAFGKRIQSPAMPDFI